MKMTCTDSRCWRHMDNRDPDISLCMEIDGRQADFVIRWHRLQDRLVPRLEMFDDSWWALPHLGSLLGLLADVDSLYSPDEMIELLVWAGFEPSEYEKRRIAGEPVV